MTDLRTAAQQALEALEASGCLAFKNIMCRCSELCGSYTAAQHLRAALAQQAEPVQDQRCRAEPRSDGDFVCDCKIGECPGKFGVTQSAISLINIGKNWGRYV